MANLIINMIIFIDSIDYAIFMIGIVLMNIIIIIIISLVMSLYSFVISIEYIPSIKLMMNKSMAILYK